MTRSLGHDGIVKVKHSVLRCYLHIIVEEGDSINTAIGAAVADTDALGKLGTGARSVNIVKLRRDILQAIASIDIGTIDVGHNCELPLLVWYGTRGIATARSGNGIQLRRCIIRTERLGACGTCHHIGTSILILHATGT